jgi:hypothetical protein
VTAPSHSLSQRYGAPPRWRRYFLIGLVVVLVAGLGGLLIWIIRYQSDPMVSSELLTFDIVDDHTATAVIRVKWGDGPVDAECTVQARAQDKEIVGEKTFVPAADAGQDHSVEIATSRRATSVENIGCTTDGQPRPR